MITVYAILEPEFGEIYVGMSNNLERRLAEHKRGQSKYTKKFKNILLIYKEEYSDYKSARKREKYFKSDCGKEYLRTLI